MMLEPAKVELLKCYSGLPYEVRLQFWADEERTIPFDLTGYTVTAQTSGGPTLTEGQGIGVTPGQGEVTVQYTAEQTMALRNSPTVLALFFDDLFPFRGTFQVEAALGVSG